MGSGLVKCFITNQTIPEGIEVVVFPIIQNSTYRAVKLIDRQGKKLALPGPNNTTVYTNCLYSLQGVKFHTLADDYADNSFEDTLENKYSFILMLQYLYQYSLTTVEGENEYHDLAFDIKKFIKKHKINLGEIKERPANKYGPAYKYMDFYKCTNPDLLKSLSVKKMNEMYEKLLELADKNRIFVQEHSECATVFKFAICLKSAYDYMIKNAEPSYGLRNFDAQVTSVVNSLASAKDSDMNRFRVAELFTRIGDGESTNHDYMSLVYDLMDKLPKKITEKDIINMKNQLPFLFDIIKFQAFLNQNQILIQPITGYQQDYQNEDGNNFVKLVAHCNQQVGEFLKEKYGEFEDEESEA